MSDTLRAIAAGVRLQIRLALVVPVDFILSTVLMPVFYTIVFLLLLKSAGRLEALATFGIIAPAMIGMWYTALSIAGEIVDNERSDGLLEILAIAPRSGMLLVIVGRILAVTLLSLLSILEAMLIARIGFGVSISIAQPVAFGALLLLSALSVAAAAFIMATTFVLSRSVRLFQNLLSFPFYLLGGLAFPVEVLPQWLQPLSRAISLSWASEGLRQSMTTTPVSARPFLALIVLTLVYALLGKFAFANIERRIRFSGSIGVS